MLLHKADAESVLQSERHLFDPKMESFELTEEDLERFEEEGIDAESFDLLDEEAIAKLFPKAGPRLFFKKKYSEYIGKNPKVLAKSFIPEISSLSSFTSDTTLSTPMEDKFFKLNVKQLIYSYENKLSTSKNSTRTPLLLDSNKLDRGVNDLRWPLQKTIDQCFKSSDTNKDTINTEKRAEIKSVSDDTIQKFRTYVKKVATYAKHVRRTNNPLFYCCLILEWIEEVRRIIYQFPNNVIIPNKIEDLCFPDAAYGPMDRTVNAQSYSLVITDEKGERTYGYCRRVIPEGSTKCLPIVYCILSKHRAPRFYNKILTELESRHGISDHHRNNIMSAIYNNKFPEPGQTIRIKLCKVTLDSNKKKFSGAISDKTSPPVLDQWSEMVSNYEHSIYGENLNISFNFHHDSVYENSDLKPLHQLSTDILIKVFSSLLLERKVIFISCLLSKLSSCIEALHTILYPFSWPYTYIPVLPRSLWEFVESPTPIICGILSVDVINKHEIEHAIVVDLDEGCILKDEGDEDSILCSYMLKAWHKSIAIAKTIPVHHEAHSCHLSYAYLHMFVVALRNYKKFIIQGQFQRKAFIRDQKSKGVRRFLKWFTETTMFLTFIDGVISNSQDYSLFDTKISMYCSENSGVILNKLLGWKR